MHAVYRCGELFFHLPTDEVEEAHFLISKLAGTLTKQGCTEFGLRHATLQFAESYTLAYSVNTVVGFVVRTTIVLVDILGVVEVTSARRM